MPDFLGKWLCRLAPLCLAIAFISPTSDAQYTHFLWIEGIEGEETRANWEGWHRLYGFEQEYTRGEIVDQRLGNDPIHGAFHLTMAIGTASARLRSALFMQTVIPHIHVRFLRPDPSGSGGDQTFAGVTLNNVKVVEVNTEHPQVQPVDGYTPRVYEVISFYPQGEVEWEGLLSSGGTTIPPPTILAMYVGGLDAYTVGSDVIVSWHTDSHVGLSTFEIQRLQEDNFVTIEHIQVDGTQVPSTNYEVSLSGLEPGAHTFRIKTVMVSGETHFSDQIKAAVPLVGESYRLTHPHPNPTAATSSFDLTLEVDQDVRIAVYDVTGREIIDVYTGQLEGGKKRRFDIDVGRLSAGIYLLRVDGMHVSETRIVNVVR